MGYFEKFIIVSLAAHLWIPSILLGEASIETEYRGKAVISFRIGTDSFEDRWVVRALEQNFKRDLEAYPRLEIQELRNFELESCKDDIDCRLSKLKNAGVDVYIDGVGIKERVEWKSYHTSTKMLLDSGAVRRDGDVSAAYNDLDAGDSHKKRCEGGRASGQVGLRHRCVEPGPARPG